MKQFGYWIIGLFLLTIIYEYNAYAGACLSVLVLVLLLINRTDFFKEVIE